MRPRRGFWLPFLCASVFVGLVWYLWAWALLPRWGLDRDKLAQIGDSFGGISALFSGLAFAAVAVTLYLQSKELQLQSRSLERQGDELELQRKQLELQRQELSNSVSELRAQREVMSGQLGFLKMQAGEKFQPRLVKRLVDQHGGCLRVRFRNLGEGVSVRGIGLRERGMTQNSSLQWSNTGGWDKDEEKSFVLTDVKAQSDTSVDVYFSYADVRGWEMAQHYELARVGNPTLRLVHTCDGSEFDEYVRRQELT